MDSLHLYARHWPHLLALSGAGALVLWGAFALALAFGEDLRDHKPLAYSLVGIELAWMAVALEVSAQQLYESGRVLPLTVLKQSWMKLLFCAGVVLCMFVLFGTIMLIPLLGLLVIAYLYVRLHVAFEAVIISRPNPVNALRLAWSLTKGQFWRALGRVALFHVGILALAIPLALLPPNRLVIVLFIALVLPVFTNFRVLAYFDFLNRQSPTRS